MVQTQLISRSIKNKDVLDAFLKVPRHNFVDYTQTDRAYDDNPLPIGFGQTISQPYMVAYMLDNLDLQKNHKVLEIGTGSGYQTALLAELATQIYTIERIKDLSLNAQKILEQSGYSAKFKIGDGTLGWAEFAPFDRIIISAGTAKIPTTLINQLKDEEGILLCPEGDTCTQELVQIRKISGKIIRKSLGLCVFVKLIGSEGWPE